MAGKESDTVIKSIGFSPRNPVEAKMLKAFKRKRNFSKYVKGLIAEDLGLKEQNNPREETNMTTVNYEGKDYTLTQEAYMAGTHDQPHYEAHAVDADGNEYMVQWDVVDNWQEIAETGDQSDMCDWDNPASVEAL